MGSLDIFSLVSSFFSVSRGRGISPSCKEHPGGGVECLVLVLDPGLSSPLRAAISQADLGQHGPLHNSSGLLTGRPTSASSTEPLVLH